MTPPTHDTLIIIPAWNEADVLGGVLQEVLDTVGSFADLVVVSDGSTDATAEIARSTGVPVLDLSINLGVGGAMRAGYLYAQRRGYTYTVQLDADGQHAPEEITNLIQEAEDAHADVVIGARFAGKGDYSVRGPRWWAMRVLSLILSRSWLSSFLSFFSPIRSKSSFRQHMKIFSDIIAEGNYGQRQREEQKKLRRGPERLEIQNQKNHEKHLGDRLPLPPPGGRDHNALVRRYETKA